jgi:hypothetical protein
MSGSPLSAGSLRQAFVIALVVYGVICLTSPENFRLLDSVDLAIHETGHLVFAPFGEFIGFLGGTLLQLLVPLLFVGYFIRQQDRFAASVVLWWVAQNLWNISVYVADARAQALPLVGGGEHDWAYLLGRLGLMQQDQTLSGIIYMLGVLLFAWSVWQALRFSSTPASEPEAA